jgi:MFS family permease
VRVAANETFRSLRVRNFRLFFGGQLVSQIGNWLTMVALSLLVLDISNKNGIALGFLAAAQFGPVLLIGAWAGLIADRSDKRRLLLIIQAIAMLESFALALLAFGGSHSLAAFYSVALVGGVTVAFDNPARRAFVVEMVPDEDMSNAVSLNSAIMTSSRIFGPAIAGILVVTVGYGWAFLADGLSYLAVLAALYAMRTSELHPPPVARRGKGQVREGLRYATHVPELWIPLAMMAVVGMLAYNFQTVFPIFVTRTLGGTKLDYTILFSIVSVGALIGALATARRHSIEVRDVALASMAYGAALGLMTFAPNEAFLFPLGLLLGASSIAFLTASTAIVQVRAAPEMRGRVLALQAILFLGSTPIGGPILGWICQAFGARYGVAVGAVAGLAAGAWGLAMSRRRAGRTDLDDERARASVESAVAELDDDVAAAAAIPNA